MVAVLMRYDCAVDASNLEVNRFLHFDKRQTTFDDKTTVRCFKNVAVA